MTPTECHLGTGKRLKLINENLIHPERWSSVKITNLPHLCTATKKPIPLDGIVLLPLCTGDLQTRVWFGIVLNMSVSLLLGTSFIDHFMRGNFPAERKVVPRYSQPVDILSTAQKRVTDVAAPIRFMSSPTHEHQPTPTQT